ncbi:MAG: YbhB/YbcL family Raf kinase inhibitor-like protein [Acidobacteria bacterium]|nr:MAG: YbhB/YbcL family Raf kinase inhibitor-like protein [Acidobacteriota bacterium]
MHPLRTAINASLLLLLLATAACRHSETSVAASVAATLVLSSTSFQGGGKIPSQYTCDGADTSPQLSWPAPPSGTKSLALIVTDPDAPVGTFVHWVLYDIPASTRELPAGVPKQGQLSDNSRQGKNDFGKSGYGGPCPPSGAHHYVFTLYALDTTLGLPPGATRAQIESAIKGHILARGELVGLYNR